jgi:hypothetical protein
MQGTIPLFAPYNMQIQIQWLPVLYLSNSDSEGQ